MVDSIAKVLQEGKTAEEAASWLSDAVKMCIRDRLKEEHTRSYLFEKSL